MKLKGTTIKGTATRTKNPQW